MTTLKEEFGKVADMSREQLLECIDNELSATDAKMTDLEVLRAKIDNNLISARTLRHFCNLVSGYQKTEKGINWKRKLEHESGWFKRNSIFMPKWAARTWLEVIRVKVERVQDIKLNDIEAEGIITKNTEAGEALELWIKLWDRINAKRGFGWDVNPWVWVYEFKVKSKS